jgi:hypothetical protein
MRRHCVIVQGDDYPSLQIKINNLLEAGYQPSGGIAVAVYARFDDAGRQQKSFYQLMIYENPA